MSVSKDKARFTNSSGVRLTKQLFVEYSYLSDGNYALYTLAREDKDGYPSLYRLYMEEKDLSEARFAEKYFYDWDHWLKVQDSAFFKEFIPQWRTELKNKIKGELIDSLMADAHSKSKSSTSSAKYLLDKFASVQPKGRPKRSPVEGTSGQDAISKEQEQDLLRVLNVTDNGN